MTTFLIVLVLFGLGWLVLLHYRYHTLNNAVANSEEMAGDALTRAEALLQKVETELKKQPPKAAPKRKS